MSEAVIIGLAIAISLVSIALSIWSMYSSRKSFKKMEQARQRIRKMNDTQQKRNGEN